MAYAKLDTFGCIAIKPCLPEHPTFVKQLFQSRKIKFNLMKTLKIISFKLIVSFSFVVLLLFNACTQSGNNNNTRAENNVEAKSKAETPKIDLQTAIISGNLEVVKKHVEAGTDINMKDQMSSATPLILAATFGKAAIAKALIEAGANLNLKNNEGSTALHAAAFFCRVEIVQMLIDARADKTIKNNFGATPRETVAGSFAETKPIYEMLLLQLEPFGLKLDLKELEKTRPVVAMMLQ
ncbi:MAG: ankyrin repeat domain-containing protein [Prolixibacteraceae bacterium]